MNTICMEEPSEGILTLFGQREVTQERNEMNVKNVGECLVVFHPFRPTCALTLARNPVRRKASGHHPSFMTHMRIHTGEKSYEFNQHRRGYTIGRSCINARTVERLHQEQEPDRA